MQTRFISWKGRVWPLLARQLREQGEQQWGVSYKKNKTISAPGCASSKSVLFKKTEFDMSTHSIGYSDVFTFIWSSAFNSCFYIQQFIPSVDSLHSLYEIFTLHYIIIIPHTLWHCHCSYSTKVQPRNSPLPPPSWEGKRHIHSPHLRRKKTHHHYTLAKDLSLSSEVLMGKLWNFLSPLLLIWITEGLKTRFIMPFVTYTPSHVCDGGDDEWTRRHNIEVLNELNCCDTSPLSEWGNPSLLP